MKYAAKQNILLLKSRGKSNRGVSVYLRIRFWCTTSWYADLSISTLITEEFSDVGLGVSAPIQLAENLCRDSSD